MAVAEACATVEDENHPICCPLLPDRLAVYLAFVDAGPVYHGLFAIFSDVSRSRTRFVFGVLRLRVLTRFLRARIQSPRNSWSGTGRAPSPSRWSARCGSRGACRRTWRGCAKASRARPRKLLPRSRNRLRCSRSVRVVVGALGRYAIPVLRSPRGSASWRRYCGLRSISEPPPASGARWPPRACPKGQEVPTRCSLGGR